MNHHQVDKLANARQMETVLTVVHVRENFVAVAAAIVERWRSPGKYAWNVCQKNEPSTSLRFPFAQKTHRLNKISFQKFNTTSLYLFGETFRKLMIKLYGSLLFSFQFQSQFSVLQTIKLDVLRTLRTVSGTKSSFATTRILCAKNAAGWTNTRERYFNKNFFAQN